mmetsp:Transcript_17739/g.46835  ORF Transcript_17739/g.46835 Transcript_17739/m.46835 type:complete len:302 (-) Transcript_17739:430-1335(-)
MLELGGELPKPCLASRFVPQHVREVCVRGHLLGLGSPPDGHRKLVRLLPGLALEREVVRGALLDGPELLLLALEVQEQSLLDVDITLVSQNTVLKPSCQALQVNAQVLHANNLLLQLCLALVQQLQELLHVRSVLSAPDPREAPIRQPVAQLLRPAARDDHPAGVAAAGQARRGVAVCPPVLPVVAMPRPAQAWRAACKPFGRPTVLKGKEVGPCLHVRAPCHAVSPQHLRNLQQRLLCDAAACQLAIEQRGVLLEVVKQHLPTGRVEWVPRQLDVREHGVAHEQLPDASSTQSTTQIVVP